MKSFGVVARVKAPEGYIGQWINIYKRGANDKHCSYQSGGSYDKRKWADIIAKPYRHDCVYVHIKVG